VKDVSERNEIEREIRPARQVGEIHRLESRRWNSSFRSTYEPLGKVDAGHLVALLAKGLGESAGAGPNVEDLHRDRKIDRRECPTVLREQPPFHQREQRQREVEEPPSAISLRLAGREVGTHSGIVPGVPRR